MVGICRLCASLRRDDLLTTVLTDASHNVCRQLRACFCLEINMTNSLPKRVCDECVQSLQAASVFCKKVHESQTSLSALFPTKTRAGLTPSADALTLVECLAPVIQHRRGAPDGAKTPAADDQPIVIAEVTKIECEDSKDIVLGEYEMQAMDVMEPPPMVTIPTLDVIKGGADTVEDDDQLSRTNYSESDATHMEESETIDESRDELSDTDHMIEDNIDESQLLTDACQVDGITVPGWTNYAWRCWICPSTKTNSLIDFHKHGETHHGIPQNKMSYKCMDCRRKYRQYHTFLNHVRHAHQPALNLHCDVCDTLCSDYAELHEHRAKCARKHQRQVVVMQCMKCFKCFGTRFTLSKHIRDEHGGSISEFAK